MSQSETMFSHAVGSKDNSPVDVVGPRLDGLGSVTLPEPSGVAGRSPQSNIELPDRTVSLRHVYIQQMSGRVFVADLFSANGTRLGGQKILSGWWPASTSLSVGPFDLTHDLAADGEPPPSPMEFRPRNEEHAFYPSMPHVSLELLDNRAKAGQAWPINRVITFVGRDDRCRISCGHDSVSLVHCALVLTPAGLWVVDLLSRNGIRINGNDVSCGLLSDGFELEIGRYKMKAHVEDAPTKSTPSSSPSSSSGTNVAFLTRNHHIFPVEILDDVLVVKPMGDLQDFMYQDVQTESNAVIHAITAGGFRHVVVDFSSVRIVGSVIIESIAGFCRAAPGKAALCAASADMYATLEDMKLPSIWYHYATRDDAVTAVRFDD